MNDESAGPPRTVTVRSVVTPDDAAAFRAITEEWVTRLFSVTEADRRVLDDPFGTIIDVGGDVLVARVGDEPEVLGCVALIGYPDGVMELSKMGVRPAAQGRGVGQALLDAAVERARELGAARLFLGTNSKLGSAVRLYERAGFSRITREELPVSDYYARADLLMELRFNAE